MSFREEAEASIRRWLAATAAGDAEALAALVTEDARFYPAAGPAIVGRDGVRNLYRAMFERFSLVQRSELEDVQLDGATIVAVAGDRLEMTPRDGGKTVNMAGRAMMVLRRGDRGDWLFHRGINNMAAETKAD